MAHENKQKSLSTNQTNVLSTDT